VCVCGTHTSDITHSYKYSQACVQCDMTHSHVCHDSHTCDMTHLHVCHDSHTCDMTHSHVCHDSHTRVPVLILLESLSAQSRFEISGLLFERTLLLQGSYKRDLQKRPAKENCKKDISHRSLSGLLFERALLEQSSFTKRDLQKRPLTYSSLCLEMSGLLTKREISGYVSNVTSLF